MSLLVPTTSITFRIGRLPPSLVQILHVAVKERFAQLLIDAIVLVAQPQTQLLPRVHLDGRLFQIALKIGRTPRAGIKFGQGVKEIGHFVFLGRRGLVGVPCRHGVE